MSSIKGIGKALALLVVGAAGVMGAVPAQAAVTTLGPSQYFCFDSSSTAGCAQGSPFAANVSAGKYGGAGGYFYLETFEDKSINTLGVTSSAPNGSIAGLDGNVFSTIVDSVDADDGVLDGNGLHGHSLFADGASGITFTFDASLLGVLPTDVGIVWTDGAIRNNVTVQAFDANDNLIASIVGLNLGDDNFLGGASEDRFFGFISDEGIAKLKIFNSAMSGGGNGIEVDHLQYGHAGKVARVDVPEPATLTLLGLGLAGLAAARRRRR